MTLKEKLLEAGIWKGFIQGLEGDCIRMHGPGISQEEYKEYVQKCTRFTDQCMLRLHQDVEPENNPNPPKP